MEKKLEISSYKDIEITRIREHSIHFKYKDEHYFLHKSDGFESYIDLYRKMHGKNIFVIQKMVPNFRLSDFIEFLKNKTYSQVDLLHFANKLISLGFATGEYKNYSNNLVETKIIKKLTDLDGLKNGLGATLFVSGDIRYGELVEVIVLTVEGRTIAIDYIPTDTPTDTRMKELALDFLHLVKAMGFGVDLENIISEIKNLEVEEYKLEGLIF